MTNKEKKIPDLITSSEYIRKIFEKRIKDIDKRAVKVLDVKSYIIKRHVSEDFFHFVIQNNVTLKINKGLRRRYQIFAVSFSGHGRRKMYQILELAFRDGFNKGMVVMPRPLWYIDDLMSAFYVGIPGDNFLEHIKNGHIDLNCIKKIAKGLFQLHQIKMSGAEAQNFVPLRKHKFSWDYLDPTDILDREHNVSSKFVLEIRKQFKSLKTVFKEIMDSNISLSHGDFHPENVIVNKFNSKQVALIDFSEACLAPIYFDIASFLQQLHFMTRSYLTEKQYASMEKAFLSAYFGEVIITPKMKAKINLYKAWTALKSTVYFMIFDDEVNRGFAEYLLKKSKEYLVKAIN
ncbi:MAG: phosphotransferase [Candidatus Kuenenbacteria bacterium]